MEQKFGNPLEQLAAEVEAEQIKVAFVFKVTNEGQLTFFSLGNTDPAQLVGLLEQVKLSILMQSQQRERSRIVQPSGQRILPS